MLAPHPLSFAPSWRARTSAVPRWTRRALLLSVVALAMLTAADRARPPRTWLWAWERSEDLRFLAHDADVGVAVLVATVTLDANDAVRVRRRAHPLLAPSGMPRIAVVHVEAAPGAVARSGEEARSVIAGVAREVAALPNVSGVQLDFDARASELEFYARTLREVRVALPARTPLTITALASWCTEGGAVRRLAPLVDGVVPMVFSLGREGTLVRAQLQAAPFEVQACRAHLGVSVDAQALPHRGAEVWAFSRRAWTPARFEQLRAQTGGGS